MDLQDMFPDEDSAIKWFESTYWANERCCGHCGSTATSEVPKRKPMPYWCKDCRSYFSVRTGTALQNSRLPLRKWAIAVYLYVTNLKSVSSVKLHRDIKVRQATAWFMLHRIRQAWDASGVEPFDGPVEVDETFMGGKRRNMPNAKRKKLTGRGSAGKTAVVGAKDRATNKIRARVVRRTDGATLKGFIHENTEPTTKVYTDEASAYENLARPHESVKHSVGEYVRDQAHTNGIESFWSMLKRAHKGTFHRLSPKHLDRYVQEFAWRHNIRERDTIEQMRSVVAGLVGRQLMYSELISANGLSAYAED